MFVKKQILGKLPENMDKNGVQRYLILKKLALNVWRINEDVFWKSSQK